VHFSEHGGDGALVFDDAKVENPTPRTLGFAPLARALGATRTPPTLVILNGCDTLDGAEVLLSAAVVVVAMSSQISDLAASMFATRFYAAIAGGQSVASAIQQGSFGPSVPPDEALTFMALGSMATEDKTITVRWSSSPDGDLTNEWRYPLPPKR